MSLIKTWRCIPKDLFRLNSGSSIALRDKVVKKVGSYDLVTEAGIVKAKALQPTTYKAPNGASMRPNTPQQQKLVHNFKGSNIVVYGVPAGTQLPDDLILVHEFKDHYSLQAAKDMSLQELNKKIDEFYKGRGQVFSKDEWIAKYPEATESS